MTGVPIDCNRAADDVDVEEADVLPPPAESNRSPTLNFMPIPDAGRSVVEDAKVRDYLLHLGHPDGGSKAIWFHSLGYSRDEWRLLAADLLGVARNCSEFDTEKTRFGVKYKAAGSLGRPNHRPALVLSVWIVEDDDPPRLVTAYPHEAP